MLEAGISMNLKGLEAYTSRLNAALDNPLGGELAPVFNQWGQRYRAFIQKRFVIHSKGGGDWAPLALRTILARRSGGPKGQTIWQALIKRRAKSLQVSYGKTKKQNFEFGDKYMYVDKPTKTPRKKSTLLDSVKKLRGSKSKKKQLKSTLKTAVGMVSRSKIKASGKSKTPKGQMNVRIGMLRDTGTMFLALAPVLNTSGGAMQTGFPGGIKLGFEGGTHPGKGVTVAQLALIHNNGSSKLPKRQIIVEPDDNLQTLMVADLERGIKKLDKG